MSMILVVTEPDGTKNHYNIGNATPAMASAYGDVALRRHPVGSTWAYSVVTSASWDAIAYRDEHGELPRHLTETKRN